jgi:Peptidase family S41/N-terminal domain of Peptidase_S41 in eukaryotic IRBP
MKLHHLLSPVLLSLACAGAFAQAPSPSAPVPLDAATRQRVIDQALSAMNERYIFPDVARRVEAAWRDLAQRRALDNDDAKAFAKNLTDSLQALTKDKHLRVMHSDTPVPTPSQAHRPAAEDVARFKAQEAARNFGVERVERLPGNIGYIELRGFASLEWASAAISAAMNLVAHSEALIVDLRRNGGGDPATVAWMTSYLFDERTHLNDLYFRPLDRTTQYWTTEGVPGARFGGSKPVYVLTSGRTFSGAEEFSYNLKNLKRATIVGETTGGGAHPGELRRLDTHFRMFVATGRAISPVTKTNWEGTGVEPDIKVKADDALRVAQLRALPAIRDKAQDKGQRDALTARIAELDKGA